MIGTGEETQKERPAGGAVGENGTGEADVPPFVAEIVAEAGDEPAFTQYVNRPAPALLVVLTGPSGVGKDVTIQRMRELGLKFHYVVTVTTREQRSGEEEGVHYFFRSREEYERMRENNELLEDAKVYNNYYGIPRSQVVDPLRRGEDVIMKPDVQGARTMREKEPDAIYIFLAPPSMEDLASRLYHRKTEDPQELSRRLKVARDEMHALSDFDYVVVNRNNELDETVEEIQAIIEAEKCRVHPRRIRLVEEK
ncbi:MAG: guanylate kinase [Chloroflexota bacterium]